MIEKDRKAMRSLEKSRLASSDAHANAAQRDGTATPVATRARSTRSVRGGLSGLLQRNALLGALMILILLFSALRPDTFFTVDNLTTTLGIQAAAALLAIGVTVVLLAGEFDLSVASVMGMSASVVAYLTTQRGVPILIACVVVLVASAVIGLINAIFVVKVGVHSFIVTLGVGTLVQGA